MIFGQVGKQKYQAAIELEYNATTHDLTHYDTVAVPDLKTFYTNHLNPPKISRIIRVFI